MQAAPRQSLSGTKISTDAAAQQQAAVYKKDFLRIDLMATKAFGILEDWKLDEVDAEAVVLISNHVEAKLRVILAQMLSLAERRSQLGSNPLYMQIDDPRAQVRFMETFERRRYNINQGTANDAGEINRRREEELNRKTNEAAFAALTGTSQNNSRSSSVNNPFAYGVTGGVSLQTNRPKIKVITARDVEFVLGSNPKFRWIFYKRQSSDSRFRG